MNRIPWQLEEALLGSIRGGHDFKFDPFAKEVRLCHASGELTCHRIDLYDGVTPRVFIDGDDEERTLDIVHALGAMIGPAARIASEYEIAACAARRASDEELARFELSYVKAAEKMRKYSEALYALKSWYAFQVTLAEQRAHEAEH